MKKILISFVICLCCAFYYPENAHSESPVINEDNSVTFKYYAPNAEEVFLKGSVVPSRKIIRTSAGSYTKNGKIKMTKNGDTWSCTTDALPSEFYTYYFDVDGKTEADPNNSNRVRDIADTLNYFIIKGGIGDDYLTQHVSHGSVKKVWYPSTLNGMKKRRMTIYLPSGYSSNSQKRYPVLYLLHGSGGDEDAWTSCGRAVQILDNLIASGRCVPMIVVMPNGNADLAAAPGSDPKNLI